MVFPEVAAVAMLQTDPTARAGVPTGRATEAAPPGSAGGENSSPPARARGFRSRPTSPARALSAKEIHRVVLIALRRTGQVTGLAVVGGGHERGQRRGDRQLAVADPTAVTTMTSTTVAPGDDHDPCPGTIMTSPNVDDHHDHGRRRRPGRWTHQSDWWFGYRADVAVSNPTGRPIDQSVKIEGGPTRCGTRTGTRTV